MDASRAAPAPRRPRVLAAVHELARLFRSPRAFLARARQRRWQLRFDDLAEVDEVTATVILASTPRSGSNLLSLGLGATGRFGVPSEYLGAAQLGRAASEPGPLRMTSRAAVRRWVRRLTFRRDWEATFDVDPATIGPYIDDLVRRRTTPNGVFAVKVHWSQWTELQQRFDFDESWCVQPVRWVYIRRRDTVAQAVSFVRAQQTLRWVSTGAGAGVSEPPVYDELALRVALHDIDGGDAGWRAYFADRGIEPGEV